MRSTIVVVEDERKLNALLDDYLCQNDFLTKCFTSGQNVSEWVQENNPDLVLLDIMLPDKDGLTVLKELRQFSQIPVIMITARVEEIDRLLGLELGADDYICKPYSPREVIARVKAVLRRSHQDAPHTTVLQLDAGNHRVTYKDMSLELTTVEFRLLQRLKSEPGRIFSRSQLMDSIYQDHRVVSDRTIDSHIKKLRKKLAALEGDEWIYSVYGAGYRFES